MNIVRCSICLHPDRARIEHLLAEGMTARNIMLFYTGTDHEISAAALSRHAGGHPTIETDTRALGAPLVEHQATKNEEDEEELEFMPEPEPQQPDPKMEMLQLWQALNFQLVSCFGAVNGGNATNAQNFMATLFTPERVAAARHALEMAATSYSDPEEMLLRRHLMWVGERLQIGEINRCPPLEQIPEGRIGWFLYCTPGQNSRADIAHHLEVAQALRTGQVGAEQTPPKEAIAPVKH